MEVDLSEECPKLAAKITELFAAHPELEKDQEAFLYALAQVLHDKIRQSDLGPEERGATVSNFSASLKDSFREDIALFHERLRYLVEQKHSTVH